MQGVIVSPQTASQLQLTSETWDFNGSETQYATHGLHTYLAAMVPPLARRLIELYTSRDAVIFDPFCGGGAVLVEAILTGREAVGCDVNALAVLISRAKTRSLDPETILSVGATICNQARNFDGTPRIFAPSDYVYYWFKPNMMRPLTALYMEVNSIEDAELRTLFQVIFSATVRDVSLTYRNEIRLRRMDEEEQRKFNPNVLERFSSRFKEAAHRITALPTGAGALVTRCSVQKLPFSQNEFTTIVCSPPYGDERNGVPYTQFAKNMLLWLGYSRADILQAKKDTLGWQKQRKKAPPSPELEHLLDRISSSTTALNEAVAFYADYFSALQEMVRVVTDRVIIVIGQRVLENTVFDNGLITAEMMGSLGIPVEAAYQRKLPSKRLPKMREYGAAIDRETILVFKK